MPHTLPVPTRALIVGINDYDSDSIRNLQGCVSDARAVATFLQEVGGMDPSQLRLLTSPAPEGGQRATRAALVSGLRDFLGGLAAGEEGLFYYSGHGSVNSLDPSISFGHTKGESLVPADARVGGVLDLLDRELRWIVAELLAKGIRLTFITDACHAGSVMRSERYRGGTPRLPDDEPVERLTGTANTELRTLASLLGGEVEATRLRRLYDEPLQGAYALLAGSLGSQKSYEIPSHNEAGEKQWRGAMTTALLQVLAGARGPLTYAELARAVRACLPEHRKRDMQYPELVGEQLDRFLFTASGPDEPRTLFAVTGREGEQLLVGAGSVDGLAVGSELRCYRDWSLSESQGRWRVARCALRRAWATPLEAGTPYPKAGQPVALTSLPNRPTITFAPGSKAVREAWYVQAMPLQLQDQYRRKKREFPTTSIDAYLSQDQDKGSAYLLEISQGGDYEVVATTEGWRVLRRDGSEVEGLQHTDEEEVARLLDRFICYERFQQPPPPAEQLQRSVGSTPTSDIQLTAESLPYFGSPVPLSLDHAGATLYKSDRLRLTLYNHTARPLYLNLYRLDPANRVLQRLWPDSGGSSELLGGSSEQMMYQAKEKAPLALLLKVSSEPLDGPTWPCGRVGDRNLALDKPLVPDESGWSVVTFTVGRA